MKITAESYRFPDPHAYESSIKPTDSSPDLQHYVAEPSNTLSGAEDEDISSSPSLAGWVGMGREGQSPLARTRETAIDTSWQCG